jgi:hypothetical protein
VDGGSRGLHSHFASFDVGCAPVCLVDLALRSVILFGLMRRYLTFSR